VYKDVSISHHPHILYSPFRIPASSNSRASPASSTVHLWAVLRSTLFLQSAVLHRSSYRSTSLDRPMLASKPTAAPHSSPDPLQLHSSLACPIPHGVSNMRGIVYLLRFAATPIIPFCQHCESARCGCYSAPSSPPHCNAANESCMFWTMVLSRSVSRVQSIEAVADPFVVLGMQVFTAGGACARRGMSGPV